MKDAAPRSSLLSKTSTPAIVLPALAVVVSLMVSEVWLVRPGVEIDAFTVGPKPEIH